MRTYKNPKSMAKALRAALGARSVLLSHSDCLEIVAKQFGFPDWNTLSARIDAPEHPVSCSFCNKSKHEVRSLIEGGCHNRGMSPCVFICDECVAFSAQINGDIQPVAVDRS